jgi:hypothetical protein
MQEVKLFTKFFATIAAALMGVALILWITRTRVPTQQPPQPQAQTQSPQPGQPATPPNIDTLPLSPDEWKELVGIGKDIQALNQRLVELQTETEDRAKKEGAGEGWKLITDFTQGRPTTGYLARPRTPALPPPSATPTRR